jgi:hypothetical protein
MDGTVDNQNTHDYGAGAPMKKRGLFVKSLFAAILAVTLFMPLVTSAADYKKRIKPEDARMAYRLIVRMGEDALSTKDYEESLYYFAIVLKMNEEYPAKDDTLIRAHRGIARVNIATKKHIDALLALKKANSIAKETETLRLMVKCADKLGMKKEKKQYKGMINALK